MTKPSIRKGGLVVISGPAGVGKTTLVRELLKTPGLTRSVSATTRAARGNEQDGRDYLFYTPERFEKGVREGEFLEHAVIHGQRYGTPRVAVERAVAEGSVVVLAIDVQGAATLRAMKRPFYGIFLRPPSLEELRRRLAGRGDTPSADVDKRMALAMEEMKRQDEYDLAVVNDSVDRAVGEILKSLRERQILWSRV